MSIEAYKIGATQTKPQRVCDYGNPYAVVPDGFKVVDLDKFSAHPSIIRDTKVFSNYQAYEAFVDKFKTPQSITFAGWFSFVTIFDYHHFANGGILTAGNCGFVAKYFSLTANWQTEEYLRPSKDLPKIIINK